MIRPRFVAVGASLGGLEATQTLLRGLPGKFPVPVGIVQHRRRDTASGLAHLLATHSALPVREPDDKEPIRSATVYLAPANYHLLVESGHFALSIDEPVRFARPSIDVFFESVADAFGPRALCVVLTGSNEDAAKGAAAIKARGGTVFVEDPKTAMSPVAPSAVIERVEVDGIFPIEELGRAIVTCCNLQGARSA